MTAAPSEWERVDAAEDARDESVFLEIAFSPARSSRPRQSFLVTVKQFQSVFWFLVEFRSLQVPSR